MNHPKHKEKSDKVNKSRSKKPERRQSKGKQFRNPPSQRSLLDYVVRSSSCGVSESSLASSQQTRAQSGNEEDESGLEEQNREFESFKMKISDLVNCHKLNEIVALFHMRDRIRMSDEEMRKAYLAMQQEVVRIFGAPLSGSLFPDDITRKAAFLLSSSSIPSL
jgi:hypothetical protein